MKHQVKRILAIIALFALFMLWRHQFGFEATVLLVMSTIFIYTKDNE